MIRHDTTRCTYDTIRHDTTRYNTIRYDTTRYDTIRRDTIRYDTTRYDTIRYDDAILIRYDTTRYDDTTIRVVSYRIVPLALAVVTTATYPNWHLPLDTVT